MWQPPAQLVMIIIGVHTPSVATCLTGTPVLTDMKPRTEKITKPPNTLVAQLISDTITESLDRHNTITLRLL